MHERRIKFRVSVKHTNILLAGYFQSIGFNWRGGTKKNNTNILLN